MLRDHRDPPQPWTLYCVSQLGLASAYILKQSAMFQTSLLSAKKQRLELALTDIVNETKKRCDAERSVSIYYFI